MLAWNNGDTAASLFTVLFFGIVYVALAVNRLSQRISRIEGRLGRRDRARDD